MDSCEQTLWQRWREGREAAARDALVVKYSPWTRLVARDVYMRIHSLDDIWSDCVQNALVGLLEAIDRFDPFRGASFQTFARYRVRGAVFNGLRTLRESLARGTRVPYRVEAVRDRLESFENDESSDPLDAFVAVTVGLGLGFLLDSASFPGSEAVADAYAELEKAELAKAVLDSLPLLGEREQTILTLHYYHYLPFVDVAAQLGVTKGRVSQLHKRALEQLRQLLSERVVGEY